MMSATLERLNENALKFNEEIAVTVKEISNPLLKCFGITNFGYSKIKEDGTLLRLSANKSLTRKYFQKQYYNDPNLYCFDKIPFNVSHFKIYTNQPVGDNLTDLYEENVWNICTLSERLEKHVELSFFASTRENTGIIDFYLNHQDVLKDFVQYFKGEMKTVIDTAVHDVWIKTDLKIQEVHLQEDRKLSKFLRQINQDDKSDLTPRELECIKYLITGKSIKEIAKILKLSPRTVEFYLNKVKAKTGCKRTHQLMRFFSKKLK